jgi:hypothetical protein
MFVDGTPTAGVVPGRFQFSTANSAGTNVPRLTVFSNDNVVMSTNGGMVGIGTSSPTAKLEVKGTAKFDGNITFASTQTFPITGTGGGTITSVATTSPLTGSATSGAVTVGLNTSALETTLNGVYAQLGALDTFSKPAYFNNAAAAFQTTGPGYAGFLGWGSNGSIGTFGDSDAGQGVEGESTSGQGVFGFVSSPAAYSGSATTGPVASSGVTGSTGLAFSANYTLESGIAYAGVWADTSAGGAGGIPVALFATADDGYAAAFINKSTDTGFPAVFVQNSAGNALEASSSAGHGVDSIVNSPVQGSAGVLGLASGPSSVAASYNIYGGVWGDTGISAASALPAWAIGVIGTADDSYSGVFLNDSTTAATVFVKNYATGGSSGLFKTFMASSADGTCGISGGSMSCTGPIKSLASTGGGTRTVETYAVQSPESWMEDFGAGKLENGVAVVTIDPAFGETVTPDASYHVFLTPNGDSKGLYVIAKTATTFEVRESGGGTSTLTFDFRIVAKRRGFETRRLVDVTEPFTREMKAAEGMRGAVPHKITGRPRQPLEVAANAHPRRVAVTRPPVRTRPPTQPVTTARP